MRIVGIGTSAGGIEALSEFLVHLPLDLGAPIIIIKHLAPDMESALQEVLTKKTTYPVVTVTGELIPQANTIYLNAPGQLLIYKKQKLQALSKDTDIHLEYPIDHFFDSLAGEVGEDTIAIILSGAGSDGARGARSVKEQGGLVLVQDPQSAKFKQMPKAAIDLGIADHSLSAAALAEKLGRIFEHKQELSEKKALINLESRADRSYFNRILNYLKNYSDIDFTQYREPTLIRRLEKRILLHQSKNLEDYFNLLHGNRKEMASLFQDFIINVTQFFRDPDAFELLSSKILPEIIDNSDPDKAIRMWVPACSTGEEAYSLAIALSQYLEENNIERDFKIFGSDISKDAINFAAAGIYPANIEVNIPDNLLGAYFVKEGDHYLVRKKLRERMLFAVQDVLRDPPFIRMDLISCRNLMIYLKPETQRSVLATFHFALNRSAFLFLGSSESTGELRHAFEKISTRWSFFRKKEGTQVTSIPSRKRNLEKLHWSPSGEHHSSALPSRNSLREEESVDPFTQFLIDNYAPKSLFLDKHLNIKYIHGEMDHILKVPRSLPLMNLYKMMDKGDLSVFRTGVKRTLKSDKPTVLKNINLTKTSQEVDLHFRKIDLPELELDTPVIQVEITPSSFQEKTSTEGEEMRQMGYLQERIKNLKEEVKDARKQTTELVKELETTNEELESSNRELLASNEELQSTNLELQSINEELYSVNSELQAKNDELNIANDDLKNLLKSTGIGTIFLDNQLHIRRFTPAVKQQFNLIETDVGRPITDFSYTFDGLDIGEICKEVFNSLNSFEKEVTDKKGNHSLLRVLPYRTEEDEIKGLVLTFVDINELVEARGRSLQRGEKFSVLFENSDLVLLMINADQQINSANRNLGKYSVQQLEGKPLTYFVPDDRKEKINQLIETAFRENQKSKIVLPFPDMEDKTAFFDLTFIPSKQKEEHAFILVSAEDVSLRELLKEEVSFSLTQYESFMKHTRRPIALIDREGKVTAANSSFRSMYKQPIEAGYDFYGLLEDQDSEKVKHIIGEIFEGKPYDILEIDLKERSKAIEKFSLFATPIILQESIQQVALISETEIESGQQEKE